MPGCDLDDRRQSACFLAALPPSFALFVGPEAAGVFPPSGQSSDHLASHPVGHPVSDPPHVDDRVLGVAAPAPAVPAHQDANSGKTPMLTI